jgi:putative transcriptional regulator
MRRSMKNTVRDDVVTSDDVLVDYAAGNLSPAKHMMIACQKEIAPKVAERISFQEDVASSFMTEIKSKALSSDFLQNTIANLPKRYDGKNDNAPATIGLAPKTLRTALGHGLRDLKWKSLIPGVAVHDVMGNRRYDNGDRLYLLRAKGGVQMPEHSHQGEEWSLLLAGSYTVGDKIYSRGDIHIEDETETHAPFINEGEDCICLVMTQGPLVMKSLIPKLVQKVVGI